MGAHDDLAAAIAANLPSDPDVQVYPYPADVVVLPSVVLVPSDPWIEPATFGTPGVDGATLWRIMVMLTGIRTVPDETMQLILQLRQSVIAACDVLGANWGSLTQPATVNIGDVPALESGMAIEWITDRKD